MLERSPSTDRALTLPRPRMRGVSHLVAFVISVPAGVWLIAAAGQGQARLAALAFGGGVSTMLGASALVHLRRWSERTTEVLFRLDHTAIFLAIAGTATAIGVLGLTGWPRSLLVWGAWSAAGVGIVLEWLPFAPPPGFANTVYLTMGWLPVLLVPWLIQQAGWSAVALLAGGGLLYTTGAIIVGLRRPDPNPHVFGYHEIWHLLVVGAVAFHYVMVAFVLLPL